MAVVAPSSQSRAGLIPRCPGSTCPGALQWFFLFVAWIWRLISVDADILRSYDLGCFGKASVLFALLPASARVPCEACVDVPNGLGGEAVVSVGPALLRLAGHPGSAAWTSPLAPLLEFAVERVDLLGG
jgi:hypothetical protein